MTAFEIFVKPATLFQILAETLSESKARILFQRHNPKIENFEFTEVNVEDLAADKYLSGGYTVIYITVGKGPKNSTDWAFVDREEPLVIEISGARMKGKKLELSTIRPMSKKSKVEALIKTFVKKLDALSNKGVFQGDQPYPKIRVAKDAVDLDLYLDLNDKQTLVKPS